MAKKLTMVLIVVSCLGFACVLAGLFGVRLNITPSLPLGIWFQKDKPDEIERGAYVSCCPELTDAFIIGVNRNYFGPGTCPGNHRPLIKQVVGLPGDFIAVDTHVAINGVPVRNSGLLAVDSANRPLPQSARGEYFLDPDHYFLMSDYNPRSFDSRYFGAVNESTIIGVMVPVLTW